MKTWILAAVSIPVFFVCACGAATGAGDAWTPPETLVGTWEGGARVFGVKGAESGKDSVRVSITLSADGTVTGKVGNALFHGCRAASNRGWISRALNIRTEYIVHGGTLEGPVVPGDTETSRTFTLPFSFRDGGLKGGMMIKKGWRYPKPLLRLDVRKVER